MKNLPKPQPEQQSYKDDPDICPDCGSEMISHTEFTEDHHIQKIYECLECGTTAIERG